MTAPATTQIAGFRGDVITPEHDGYDEARAVWNGTVERRAHVLALHAERVCGVGDAHAITTFPHRLHTIASPERVILIAGSGAWPCPLPLPLWACPF